MKVVVQRVEQAQVVAADQVVGRIGLGFLVYLGCEVGDLSSTARRMGERLGRLRIFEDAEGKTNLDLKAVGGSLLLISQFTLAADLRRGNRPSFTNALAPEGARILMEDVRQTLEGNGFRVECGVFGASMKVCSTNLGPATYLLQIREA